MNKLLIIAAFALGFVQVAAIAGPFDSKLVPAESKWVLHLDGEAFRQSKLGELIVNRLLEPKVEKAENDIGSNLNFSFKQISSLTAFGARMGEGADREGALLLRTTTDVKPDLEKLIALRAASGGDEPDIARITADGVEIFTLGKDLFATQAATNLWILSKSKSSLAAAREVALGNKPGRVSANMSSYPAATNTFFFLAIAETATEGLPAQAQLLKKAQGARFVIGERGDKVFLELSLKATDPEVRTQLQQALQGLVAFVSLAKSDDKDLMSLANSASISADNEFVSASLTFPLERAIQKVREDNDL